MTEQQVEPKRKPLAAAEAGARHLLLMVGFGVMSFVGGMIFMGSLLNRLAMRTDLGWGPLPYVMAVLTDGGWVLGALPAMAYLAARFMDLKPWPMAIIGAGSGLMFQIALIYVSVGEDGLIGSPVRLALRIACVVGGVFLTATAVKRARAHAKLAEDQAKVEAEKKKSQYDDFVKQAEALAERREQVPIAAAPQAPAPEAAPAAPSGEAAKAPAIASEAAQAPAGAEAPKPETPPEPPKPDPAAS
jgi:hypothetical protein